MKAATAAAAERSTAAAEEEAHAAYMAETAVFVAGFDEEEEAA